MALYLVVEHTPDGVETHELEADSIRRAVDMLVLLDGESVEIYRVVGKPRKVTVSEETVRKVTVE